MVTQAALALKVIGPRDVGPVDSFDYYAGEERTVTFQVINAYSECKDPVPTGSTNMQVTFPGSTADVTVAVVDGDFDTNDRSIFSVTLTELNTAAMISGWAKFEFRTPTNVQRIAYSEFVQSKLTTAE